MSYNSQQQLSHNIKAVWLALQWKEGETLSAEDIAVLQNYSGFGGLKAILFPFGAKEEWIKLNASKADLKLYPQVMELHQLLQSHFDEKGYKDVVDSIKNSILTAFYTPEFVPQIIFNALRENCITPKTIYEPSAGAGVFITSAAQTFPELQQITAVEKDILTGRVLTALGSSIPVPLSVAINGFEESPQDENGKYDLIISNIPFGNFPVYDPALAFKEGTEKIHNYFFAKGMDKIREGGLLAFVTTDSFLNSPSNRLQREFLFQYEQILFR